MDNHSSNNSHLVPPRASSPHSEHAPESYHRVYVLSCAHCGCFVSDRGMKAVLLLRPSITLFSTDGMPYNCGPLCPDGSDETGGYTEQVERTCDCLTQSIGCFGCGNTIGYHIICPCSRCVDSVSKHRRAANGHRWVFHYGEVTYEERCYVSDEPGVYNAPSTLARQSRRTVYGSRRTGSSTGSTSSEEDRTSEEALRDRELAKPDSTGEADPFGAPDGLLDFHLHPAHAHSLGGPRAARLRTAAVRRGLALKQGDPVYWHHLVSAGERPVPMFTQQTPVTSRPAR